MNRAAPPSDPASWLSGQPLVLASASPFRRKMLEQAGLPVEAEPASLDERALEAAHESAGGARTAVAATLALAKALDVSRRHPGRAVLGADQTLSFEGALLHKAASQDEALTQLRRLSGREHQLTSAYAIVRDGAVLATGEDMVVMRMRAMSDADIARYGAAMGPSLLATVGGYQLEGLGAQLFAQVRGDYFTVLGLPLLKVLESLRQLKLLRG